MSNQEVINLCEKKNQIQDLLQDIFNEYNRMNETKIQNNCEKDLEMRNMSDTIRTLELSEKQKIDEIRSLKKVICDYENIINELNSKYATLEEDKKEENRFDMLRTQAKEISEKDREIERLNGLLNHYKKKDVDDKGKINNVISKVESSDLPGVLLTEVDLKVDEETNEANPNFIYDVKKSLSPIQSGEDEKSDSEDKTSEIVEDIDSPVPQYKPLDELEKEHEENKEDDKQDDEDDEGGESDEGNESENEEVNNKGNLIIITSKRIKYYAYENEVPQTVYEFNGNKIADKPLGTRLKNDKGKYKVELFAS
jgi:hypothetical protein